MKRYLLKFWLPLAIASTIVMFTMYAIMQQIIRIAANDPQIQMTEDGATFLGNGFAPASLIGSSKVDMKKSLSPFLIVYDDAGKPVASSGYLEGQIPVLPAGVLDFTRNNPDDRITWQPASTTRIAAVIKRFEGKNTGFIAAGRNLREIEKRIDQLGLMIASAWVGLMVLSFLSVVYVWAVERKEEEEGALSL